MYGARTVLKDFWKKAVVAERAEDKIANATLSWFDPAQAKQRSQEHHETYTASFAAGEYHTYHKGRWTGETRSDKDVISQLKTVAGLGPDSDAITLETGRSDLAGLATAGTGFQSMDPFLKSTEKDLGAVGWAEMQLSATKQLFQLGEATTADVAAATSRVAGATSKAESERKAKEELAAQAAAAAKVKAEAAAKAKAEAEAAAKAKAAAAVEAAAQAEAEAKAAKASAAAAAAEAAVKAEAEAMIAASKAEAEAAAKAKTEEKASSETGDFLSLEEPLKLPVCGPPPNWDRQVQVEEEEEETSNVEVKSTNNGVEIHGTVPTDIQPQEGEENEIFEIPDPTYGSDWGMAEYRQRETIAISSSVGQQIKKLKGPQIHDRRGKFS